MEKNDDRRLYFADNIDWLKGLDNASVDLVYLDPPFNSDANYNLLFKEKTGEQSAEQIRAFDDTWTWGPVARMALDQTIETGRGPNDTSKQAQGTPSHPCFYLGSAAGLFEFSIEISCLSDHLLKSPQSLKMSTVR